MSEVIKFPHKKTMREYGFLQKDTAYPWGNIVVSSIEKMIKKKKRIHNEKN